MKRGFDMVVKTPIVVRPPRCDVEALDMHELRAWMETSSSLGLGDTTDTPVAHEIHQEAFFQGVKVGVMLMRSAEQRKRNR